MIFTKYNILGEIIYKNKKRLQVSVWNGLV